MSTHRLTTTVRLPRKLIRAGILTEGGKGLFQLLTTTQLYTLLQVAWLGPMRMDRFFGMTRRTLERALSHLKKKGFIEYTQEEGYRLALKWSDTQETTWVWCWPLAFGHISIKARLMLTFCDEFIDQRYYINRQQLMKSMGIPKQTFYTYLQELMDAGLIITTGRRVGKKGKQLVCARRFQEHFNNLLDQILQDPTYLLKTADLELGPEHPIWAPPNPSWPGPRPVLDETPTRPGRDFQKGSPKGSPPGSPASDPLSGGSLRQHIMQRCNLKDPRYLEQRLQESNVLDKLNMMVPEEQSILIELHKGATSKKTYYVNYWTDAIREWNPLRYLLELSPTAGQVEGALVFRGLVDGRAVEGVRALLRAKPELRRELLNRV